MLPTPPSWPEVHHFQEVLRAIVGSATFPPSYILRVNIPDSDCFSRLDSGMEMMQHRAIPWTTWVMTEKHKCVIVSH